MLGTTGSFSFSGGPDNSPPPSACRRRRDTSFGIAAGLAASINTVDVRIRRKSAEAEPAVEAPVQHLSANVTDSAIRVNVGLLDKLMNVVGELVLTRNQILRHTAASEDAVLLGTVQRLNLLTTELQAGVMKTRMQPVGEVWSKFPRLVRDLSVACGKQVRFEMEGQETELDKTISKRSAIR